MPALHFAEVARRLGAEARAAGLDVPAFRTPPRVPGVVRTVRRYPGATVVSVVLRGRPFDQVVVDMVEGVVVANRLSGDAALRLRTQLLDAVSAAAVAAAGEPAPDATQPLASPEARVAQRQTQAA